MSTDINFLPKEDQPKRKPAVPLEPRPVVFSDPLAVKEEKINKPDSAAKIKKTFSRFFKPKTTGPNEPNTIAKDQVSLSLGGGDTVNVKEARDNLLRQIKNKSFTQEKTTMIMAEKPKEGLKPAGNKKISVDFTNKNLVGETAGRNKQPRFDFSAWLKSIVKKYKEGKLKRQNVKRERANIKAAKIKPNIKSPIMPEPVKSEPEFFNKKSEPTERQNSVAAPTLTAGEDILRTNLISDQDLAFFDWPKAIKINIIGIVASLLVIAAGFGGVVWLGQKAAPSSSLESKIAEKEQEQKQLTGEVEKLSDLRARVAEIKNILAKHIYWTNFFNLMEKDTLAGVYYDGFEGDISGQYVLPAVASDFKIFNAQMKTWQEEKDNVVSITAPKVETKKSAGSEQDVLAFEINLTVKPDIFYQP